LVKVFILHPLFERAFGDARAGGGRFVLKIRRVACAFNTAISFEARFSEPFCRIRQAVVAMQHALAYLLGKTPSRWATSAGHPGHVNPWPADWRMSLSHAMDGAKSEADHCDCAG
jgi:hypothetical protein